MRRPELLAPAGDRESLLAALAAGADAVYFGLDEGLNARARAGNFPVSDLPDTVDRIHRAGALAYLTLNTLIYEEEIAFVTGLITAAAEAGVDALIVQDPAVVLLAGQIAPTMDVHASTQMTVSSPEAARFAASLGVCRVVVPRELSVADIERFAAVSDMPLEVFVHGALCMSWSGQCLTSEAWGGRSANRGQCAQSCRLPYELVVDGAVTPTGDIRYLLSPLDLAGFRALPALAAIEGVVSLKIEGRMKGPAYVATAVQAYQGWLDRITSGHALDAEEATEQVGRMSRVYSRGFSDGFFAGSDHQDLVEGRFPKHRGQLAGVIAEVKVDRVRVVRADRTASVAAGAGGGEPEGAVHVALAALGGSTEDARGVPLRAEVVAGMGVGFDTGHPEAAEPGGTVFAVEQTPDGWWILFARARPLDLSQVRPGHRVWITADPRLEAETQRLIGAGEPEGRIAVHISVSGGEGAPLVVRMAARGKIGRNAVVELASPELLQPAEGVGLDDATLRDKLGALGGTPFRLAGLDLELQGRVHLPVSRLKAMRRALASALLEEVMSGARHATTAPWKVAPVGGGVEEAPRLIPLVRTMPQLEAVIAVGLREVELDWMELVGLQHAVRRARTAGLRVHIATVRVQKPGEEGYDRRIANLAPDGILVRHWGALMAFQDLTDLPEIHGDFSLNVTNSLTGQYLLGMNGSRLARGLHTLTASHDLDEAQLHAVLAQLPAGRVTVALHHHIPTFHTEHCVYAHTLSRGRDWRTCGRPCEHHRVALRDQQGKDHPVVVDVGCRNTVFNARAQSAASAVPGLIRHGVRRFRVELVWEERSEAEQVLSVYQHLLAGSIKPAEAVRRVGTQEQFGVTAGTMRVMGQ